MPLPVTFLALQAFPQTGQALRALIELLSDLWQDPLGGELHVSCDSGSDWTRVMLMRLTSGVAGRLKVRPIAESALLSDFVDLGTTPPVVVIICNAPDGALLVNRYSIPTSVGISTRLCNLPGWSHASCPSVFHKRLDGAFTIRSHNRITRLLCGHLLKQSTKADLTQERDWYERLDADQARLALYRGRRAGGLMLEHVSWMTFAEALLADKGTVPQCTEVADRVIAKMHTLFWGRHDLVTHPEARHVSSRIMLVSKTRKRLNALLADPALRRMATRPQRVNGCTLRPFCDLTKALLIHLEDVARRPAWGHIHGDLHFSNIMVSPCGEEVRVIDPRGAFGRAADPREGDVRYDLAKLRHSYHFQYDCFAHGLFRLASDGPDGWHLDILPWVPPAVVTRFDRRLETVGGPIRDIFLIEMALIVSALPIHACDSARVRAMMLRCSEMLVAFLDTEAETEFSLADHHDYRGQWPSRSRVEESVS